MRKTYKEMRAALTADEIDRLSVAIANQLSAVDIWDKNNFHIFLPITEQNEVNTECILHLLAGKDKNIIIAKSNFETREMTHFLLDDNTVIRKNKYNIPEPIAGTRFDVADIEVVFVPLLAFDLQGHRVGYGKGFYDQFLSSVSPDTVKIGLSFFAAVPAISNVFDSDIQLDYCVTPDEIYKFGSKSR